jgi:hypothetical protein
MKSLGAVLGAGEQVKGQKVAQDLFTGQRHAYDPFREGGLEGFDMLQKAILGQDQEGFASFMQNPNIQYQIEQGVDTATQGLAGRGMLNSGAAMRQLQGIGQDVAGQGYQDYLQNLSGLSGYGMQALGRQDMLTGQMADARIGAGQARAGRFDAIGSFGDQEAQTMSQAMMMASDKRLKENLEEVGMLNNGLKVYVGNYNDKALEIDPSLNKKPQLFLIAQEVQEVIPEAVGEKDGFLTVNYDLARGE